MVIKEVGVSYLGFGRKRGWGHRGRVDQDQGVFCPRWEGWRDVPFVLIIIVADIVQGVTGWLGGVDVVW